MIIRNNSTAKPQNVLQKTFLINLNEKHKPPGGENRNIQRMQKNT